MSTNKPTDLFTLEAIAVRLGERYGDTSSISLPKLKQFANLALIEMNDYGSWRNWEIPNYYDFTTESGEEKYALCSRVKSITSVYTKSPDRTLDKINAREYRQSIPDETGITGDPTHYYEAGYDGSSQSINIILHPVPSSVLTVYVDGDIQVPLLENDKDDVRTKCFLPQNLIYVLYDVATALLAMDLDPLNFVQAEARKDKILERAFQADQAQPDERIIVNNHHGRDKQDDFSAILPPNFG